MILVRIDRIPGNVKIPGYTEYFSVDSLSFGVGRAVEASKEDASDISISDSEVQSLNFDKRVDAASVYLMHAAMKGRTKTDVPTTLSIDIHFVQSRHYDDPLKAKAVPAAYLKIRIENAIIQNWSLTGSEDARPDESVSVWYNRAAMKYHAADEGQSFVTYGPLGWDQQTNTDWRSDVLNKK